MTKSIKVFEDAWKVYLNTAHFAVKRSGDNYLISIINNYTGARHVWINGQKEYSFNKVQYQKIKAKYDLKKA